MEVQMDPIYATFGIYAIYLVIKGKPFLWSFAKDAGSGGSRFLETNWLRAAGSVYLISMILFYLTNDYYSVPVFVLWAVSVILYVVGLFMAFRSPRVL
jgi:hypothetical protein